MKALVTGGTGFVGRHLIDALLAAGDEVTALVRSPAKAEGLAERGIHLVAGDLEADAALRGAARDQEVIYHAAGLIAASSEAGFLRVNRDGVARLLEAVAPVGRPRVVLVSSLAAAGPSTPGRPLTGGEPPAPVTAYGRSKLAGEAVLRAGPLPWTIVRPPAVYGPGDRELLKVFRAARLGLVPVFGDGRQALSLIHGADLGGALAAAGRAPAAEGGIFYAAHPEIVSSGDFVRAIGEAVGNRVRIVSLPRWLAVPALASAAAYARLRNSATLLTPDKANEFFAPAWTCDPTPLTTATGWHATRDLASGTRETAGWYRERGWI